MNAVCAELSVLMGPCYTVGLHTMSCVAVAAAVSFYSRSRCLECWYLPASQYTLDPPCLLLPRSKSMSSVITPSSDYLVFQFNLMPLSKHPPQHQEPQVSTGAPAQARGPRAKAPTQESFTF